MPGCVIAGLRATRWLIASAVIMQAYACADSGNDPSDHPAIDPGGAGTGSGTGTDQAASPDQSPVGNSGDSTTRSAQAAADSVGAGMTGLGDTGRNPQQDSEVATGGSDGSAELDGTNGLDGSDDMASASDGIDGTAGSSGPAGARPSDDMASAPEGMDGTAGSSASAGVDGSDAADDAVSQDGFPRSQDPVNTEQMGPYAFERYTDGLDNPAYSSSIMYYPTDAEPPFAAVVFAPGFLATKEMYTEFLGPLLASHGIAILLTTPTTTGDQPAARGRDLEAAVEQIATENTRNGSPLFGKLASDRVCVSGHSMGGGGSLFAATALGDSLRCAVPLQPYQPFGSFSRVSAPTLFLVAANDTIAANSSNSVVHYRSIPDGVDKYYVEVANASHTMSMPQRGSHYDVQSKYMIAFYKAYLEDDDRYLEILEAGSSDSALSEFQESH